MRIEYYNEKTKCGFLIDNNGKRVLFNGEFERREDIDDPNFEFEIDSNSNLRMILSDHALETLQKEYDDDFMLSLLFQELKRNRR